MAGLGGASGQINASGCVIICSQPPIVQIGGWEYRKLVDHLSKNGQQSKLRELAVLQGREWIGRH